MRLVKWWRKLKQRIQPQELRSDSQTGEAAQKVDLAEEALRMKKALLAECQRMAHDAKNKGDVDILGSIIGIVEENIRTIEKMIERRQGR